jgi:heme oxygenase
MSFALRTGVAQVSGMIERLNRDTRVHHAQADGDLDVLFRPDAKSSHYMLFLMRVYGFEGPLESALASTPGLELVLDLRDRSKTLLIAKDLRALSLSAVEIGDLPQCPAIPQFRGAAEALGWMYIVERMTLAHSVIRRHLLTRLPLEMEIASAYLRSYEGVAGTRWRQFGVTLDEVAEQPAIADRIVDAACEAFRGHRRWIEHTYGELTTHAVA